MIPTLTDYHTGTPIRPATPDEWARSKYAAAHEPGGTGAFDLDGRTVFVDGDYPDLHVYTVYNPASGACLGSFPGADKAAALDAYARDAGYPDFRAACEVTGDDPDDDAGLVVRETSL